MKNAQYHQLSEKKQIKTTLRNHFIPARISVSTEKQTGLARGLSRQRCLLQSLPTSVQSLGPTWWQKEVASDGTRCA